MPAASRIKKQSARRFAIKVYAGFLSGVTDGRGTDEIIDEDLNVIPLEGDGLWMRINYVFTPQEEGEEADTATFS